LQACRKQNCRYNLCTSDKTFVPKSVRAVSKLKRAYLPTSP
jgi:hypothetical protein